MLLFSLLGLGIFLIIYCLWKISNRFSYGLLIKHSCIFLFVLQLLGFFYCWFLQNFSNAKTISTWYRVVCNWGYNYENLLSNTYLTHTLWVYICFLFFFTLGICVAIKNKHFLKHTSHFQEDFRKNKKIYSKLCTILSITMLFYWIYLYYKIDFYPLKKSCWDFNTNRYVSLLYYPSIIHLISRTIPFIAFVLCWQSRGLMVKVWGAYVFFMDFRLFGKQVVY